MINFVYNGNHYQIECEKTRRFHDQTEGQTFFYGYKNGIYVKGTTSSVSEEESLSLLLELENIKLNEEIVNVI